MTTHRRSLFLVLALAVTACGETASDANAPEGGAAADDRLEGTWRLVTRFNDAAPEPGFRLFVDGHSAIIRVDALEARPILPDSGATPEQQLAVWGPFTANAGTYEIVGDTIKESITIGKSTSANPGINHMVFRVQGDTLFLTSVANSAGPQSPPQCPQGVQTCWGSTYVRAR